MYVNGKWHLTVSGTASGPAVRVAVLSASDDDLGVETVQQEPVIVAAALEKEMKRTDIDQSEKRK